MLRMRELAEIENGYRDGLVAYELARDLGHAETTIYKFFHQLRDEGVPRLQYRRRRRTAIRLAAWDPYPPRYAGPEWIGCAC